MGLFFTARAYRDLFFLNYPPRMLFYQVWDLFPSFCRSPNDIAQSFKLIAKTLGTEMQQDKEIRSRILHGMSNLIVCCCVLSVIFSRLTVPHCCYQICWIVMTLRRFDFDVFRFKLLLLLFHCHDTAQICCV